jgi:hypothetical protein
MDKFIVGQNKVDFVVEIKNIYNFQNPYIFNEFVLKIIFTTRCDLDKRIFRNRACEEIKIEIVIHNFMINGT